MAVAHQNTYSARGSSVSTLDIVSVDCATDDLILVTVATRSNVAVSSISGPNGEVMTLVKAQCGARTQARIETWKTQTTLGASGATITVTLASSATTVVAAASIYNGQNTTTPVPTSVSYNTLGSGGACSGGTDNDDATGSITTANNNSVIYAAICPRSGTMTTHTAGWTVRLDNLSQGSGGDVIVLNIEELLVATAGATTIGGANNLSAVKDWSLTGEEIAVAGGAPATTPPAGSLMQLGVGI